MSDYERIARVIRYLDEHRVEQPDLAVLAGQAGVSPFHFHRLFTTWAGITPKDFLQSLTLAHARKLLERGQSVLYAALASGLSGPGRLHDLCVSLEAASPGEVKSGGQGWDLTYGYADTPLGECILAEGPRGVCYLGFNDDPSRCDAEAALRAAWPRATLTHSDAAAQELAAGIFRRPARGTKPKLRAFVQGSAFQVRVWTALLRVPPGSLVTYGHLAAAIGQPSASRAVGNAVGGNLLAYLIPCHRVIRETGVIGNYRWGTARKRALIAWENAA